MTTVCVKATPRCRINIHQLPGASLHLSLITKALSAHSYLNLYSFNQGQLLDADWRSDTALTDRMITQRMDVEMGRRWVDSFLAKNRVKLMVQNTDCWAKYSRCWKTNREFNKRPDDDAKRSTSLLPNPPRNCLRNMPAKLTGAQLLIWIKLCAFKSETNWIQSRNMQLLWLFQQANIWHYGIS